MLQRLALQLWPLLRPDDQTGFGTLKGHLPIETRPPLPSFTRESTIQKVRLAEDGWNTKDAAKVATAYTIDTKWRNGGTSVSNRAEAEKFLVAKWVRVIDYRLLEELWTFTGSRIAVRYACEWRDYSCNWFRSYGNENWGLPETG